MISSNSEHNIREFLQANGVEEIDTVYSSSSIFGKDKIIKKFLKTYKLDASETLYVGDEARDIIACKQTGVPVIWVE